jgi:E3 ubiquitin-protein ligase HECTD1
MATNTAGTSSTGLPPSRGTSATPAPTPPPPPPRDDSTPPPTAPGLVLTLRGPCLPGVPDVEMELTEPDWTIFRAVQSVMQSSSMGTKSEKLRRVWEPTYVISYREIGAERSASRQRSADMEEHTSLPQLPVLTSSQCNMDEVLQLLRQLYIIVKQDEVHGSVEGNPVPLMEDIFNSKKVTNKLVQQIQDPLILSANAMPDWCEELTSSCPMLFPFDTRLLFFQCTAFGASRSIVWLQNQRDQVCSLYACNLLYWHIVLKYSSSCVFFSAG